MCVRYSHLHYRLYALHIGIDNMNGLQTMLEYLMKKKSALANFSVISTDLAAH